MSVIKEYREFYLRNQQVNSGNKADKELGFSVDYIIQNKSVYNRFLKGNYPSEEVFKKLLESLTFKLNIEDTAKETEQGLVKLSTQAQFDSSSNEDSEGYSLQATTKQIKAYADSIIPVGLISMWSGTIAAIPVGWLLCDGTNSTPDLKGRFIVGYDGSSVNDYDTIGKTGGEATVTLTEGQLPNHSHEIYTTEGGFATGGDVRAIDANTLVQNDVALESSLGVGNNENHENRPPFYTLAYIIKQ